VPSHRDRLPRTLGLGSATALVIGITIGSGIFRSPAGIADKLPGPFPMLSAWVVGGIFALYDTQFTPDEYRRQPHWGHSTPDDAIAVALDGLESRARKGRR